MDVKLLGYEFEARDFPGTVAGLPADYVVVLCSTQGQDNRPLFAGSTNDLREHVEFLDLAAQQHHVNNMLLLAESDAGKRLRICDAINFKWSPMIVPLSKHG